MKFNPDLHHRRSIRLRAYDYSQAGGYFVTICINNRECLLGKITAGQTRLSPAGEVVLSLWTALPRRFSGVELDSCVIMPNHVHGIIRINPAPFNNVGAPLAAPDHSSVSKKGAASGAPTLSQIIRAFKSLSALAVNRLLNRAEQPLWQRNYWERIIRSETEMQSLREYITNNPLQWELDKLYVADVGAPLAAPGLSSVSEKGAASGAPTHS